MNTEDLHADRRTPDDHAPDEAPLCEDRTRRVEELWPEGEPRLDAVLAAVLQEGLGLAQMGRLHLAGGSSNGCCVERLIRVRLDDGDDSRLAEPTTIAVVEAGLSLLRGRDPQ
jgi:hypothetical protein